jgi:hypothetical protein
MSYTTIDASKRTGNNGTSGQSRWSGTLEQRDGNSVVVIGRGRLPLDIQCRSSSDFLILSWRRKSIETGSLSVCGSSKGQDGRDGRETHDEDYKEEMLKSVVYLRYKERLKLKKVLKR